VDKMRLFGFEPTRALHAGVIMFTQRMACIDNTLVRVTVTFDKPITGMTEPALSGIIVDTQRALVPTREGVQVVDRVEVPPDLVEILTQVVGAFEVSINPPARSVDIRTCVYCDAQSAEYYIVNRDVICRLCVKKRKQEPQTKRVAKRVTKRGTP